ncbi:rhodanese-like domain-containing protein [Alicyclobacillus dauci]|uniref:Rhodanese-like domain-containing protein n=1 Tax=Alicyclobacillus dauci TaxID=1475485 RepID=A0ABY6Z0Q3_9BACL|nr:rhodanese-like domain-containing protein [Alicyclobacillus dauci]WAH36447.1 rhodanese-like domain-containing protein [Alicyclobacillus dauci]
MTNQLIINILPLDVKERLKRGESLVIVDVREVAEVVREGMIPRAKHVPLSNLADRYQEFDPRQETILVCRSGGRSHKACEFLVKMGYSNVKNMLGGMNAWDGDIER